MNLANVYGLHLGCMVYCKDDVGCETTGRLVAMRNGVKEYSVRVKYTEFNEGRWYKLKDCKLILKPLSSITKEDKRELEKQLEMYDTEVKLVGAIISVSNKEIAMLGVPNKTAIWLASKGYDIGIVPEENKIIEGE